MSMNCEICGEELDPDEETDGICENCKNSQNNNSSYEKDDDYIDPGVT